MDRNSNTKIEIHSKSVKTLKHPGSLTRIQNGFDHFTLHGSELGHLRGMAPQALQRWRRTAAAYQENFALENYEQAYPKASPLAPPPL